MSYYGGYNYQEGWDSEYDSTWEDDEDGAQPRSKRRKNVHQRNRYRRAAEDLQRYRRGYPDLSPKPNLEFHQNKIPFEPYGDYIDNMHILWRYDYNTLESNHNFIQWLFPLQERGVNPQATPLTQSEIQLMKMDGQVKERILESYKLMLGFYGIELLDPETGTVGRAEGNWKERFNNLNNNTHNNLRITRILKCLGEMGYEKFQAPLVRFFLEETLCHGNLPRVKTSALDYFMFTVKDKKERQNLVHFAWTNYKPRDEFKWGPVEKLRELDRLLQTDEAEHNVNFLKETTIKINVNSKGDSVADSEGSESKSRRDETQSLVRKTLGYISRPFCFIFTVFLIRPCKAFFALLHMPFRYFRGFFFRPRGESRSEDRENEGLFNVKREGSKTMDANMAILEEDKDKSEKEKRERLLKVHERHGSKKGEPKKQGLNDDSIEVGKKKAKLETRDNRTKHESVPNVGTGSEDQNPFLVKKMPETEPGKQDDSDTENKGDSGKASQSKHGMKVDDSTSLNESLGGAEGGTEKENNREKSENSDTKDSRTYHHGGDREVDGTQIANAGNQCGETKRYNVKPEDEGAHDGGEWGEAENLTIWKSEDYSLEEAEGGTEKEDNTENGENSDLKDSRADDHAGDREVGGTQIANAGNQWGETKRYDVKPEDEGAHDGGECKPMNLAISEPEDNRGALATSSKNTDGENIGAQTTQPKKGKAEQDDKEDKRAEDGGEKEYNDTENGGNSDGHTKHSRTDHHSGDRDDGETEILNTGNQLGETKRFNGNTEDKGVSSVEPLPPFGTEGHGAENTKFSKIEGNKKALTVGPKDNDGGNIGILNTLPETDKTEQAESDDGKTMDEGAPNVEPSTRFGEEDKDDNADLSNPEDNKRALSLRSNDNDPKNIGAHMTEPEKYETVGQNRADVSSNSETDEGMNEAGQSVDESVETADSESYKVDNKQEDDDNGEPGNLESPEDEEMKKLLNTNVEDTL